VDFARLDFDCDTPVERLDVNAPLAGDISDKLDRFSFDVNLERTVSYNQEWTDSGVSAFEFEMMERGLESFACERTALQYQEEQKRLLPPVVGWVAMALFHRYWPVGLVLLVALVWFIVRRRKASQISS
jgi:hypothetical protein